MKNKRITFFTIGFILHLLVLGVIAYWFTLISQSNLETAVQKFSSYLPAALQDTTVIMIIVAAVTTLSMIFYAAARNYSLNRVFRNLCMGLILLEAIVLIWIILSLM